MSIAGQAPETVQNAIQNFETADIKPLTSAEPYHPRLHGRRRLGRKAESQVQQGGQSAHIRQSGVPWIREIEREWRLVRGELDRVLTRKDDLPGFHELATDIATISQDHGWKSFMLCGYGFRSDRNIERCPKTWSICQKIPGLITVMFSIFEPGKHLPPHRGPYNGVLRLHLGLIVPEPREQLGIRVEKDIYRWKEGEAVVFDDAYEHEAWNYTPQTRVVLFVDFRKPLRFPANFLNWLLLHLAVFTPFIREGMYNEKAWEKKFYAEAATIRNRCDAP